MGQGIGQIGGEIQNAAGMPPAGKGGQIDPNMQYGAPVMDG